MGEDGGFDVGVGGVDGREKFVSLRLGDHRGFERALRQVTHGEDLAEARHALVVEEGLALVRRPGNEHDDLAKAGVEWFRATGRERCRWDW